MDIKVNIEGLNLSKDLIDSQKANAGKALDRLWSEKEGMTGWVQLPIKQDEDELNRLLDVAEIIKNEAGLLVVVGVGGSYLGAKAAIEALPKENFGIDVRFLGTNFSTAYYNSVLDEVKEKETVVCVVSKSGGTMEVQAAFEIIKEVMMQKYKNERDVNRRIIAITDKEKGQLREEAREKDYTTFEIPSDIGGRYSVFTPAGLLPMAVAGIDVRGLMDGAREAAMSPDWDENGTDYAVARYLMHEEGKIIEALEFNQPRFEYLGEWIKQLYGESEGKDGKGLWPATLIFSRDLHSMGQYLQQGRQVFFETITIVDSGSDSIRIPGGALKGKSLHDMNEAMTNGVIAAHKNAGIPVCEIHIPKLDAFNYGQLLYFLETTCAITAMLMDVNPFNQPGVEDYKAEMRKLC